MNLNVKKRPLGFCALSMKRLQSACACNTVWSIFVIRMKKTLPITKTLLYNFDSLKPHFYIVKLGFTGVYIIFLISVQNIDYGYSLEPPRLCFEQKKEKCQSFSSENFQFLEMKFSICLYRRVFVMFNLGYAECAKGRFWSDCANA